MRTLDEIAEALLDEVTAYPLSRSSARVAIRSALSAAREGALREALDAIQHRSCPCAFAIDALLVAPEPTPESLRCASRPEPAPEPAGTGDADKKRGLYGKYLIERRDGSSGPYGKHAGCRYFVIDLNHDTFAGPALRAYADACGAEYPDLARDLRAMFPAPEPAPESEECGAETVSGRCWLDAGHPGEHDDRLLCLEPAPRTVEDR